MLWRSSFGGGASDLVKLDWAKIMKSTKGYIHLARQFDVSRLKAAGMGFGHGSAMMTCKAA